MRESLPIGAVVLSVAVALCGLSGCSSSDNGTETGSSTSSSSGGGSGGSGGGGGGTTSSGGGSGGGGGTTYTVVPDFNLMDVNETSATYDTEVSPRDYLGHLTAWLFGSSL